MISSLSSSASSIAGTLFSRLDTKNQGYIEKTDLQSAFAGLSETGGDSSDVDAVFKQLDADGDEKVTKDEMTAAIERLSDQLNAQFDQSRVRGGGHGGHMPPPPAQSEGGGDTQYIAAADTNGDGTVSAEEAAAYEASSGSATTAAADSPDIGLQAMLGAAGAMPPPMRGDEDRGFSKDELTSQLSEIGAGDSKRSALLSRLIENFDAADADGDGKIAHDEARAFGKEQGLEQPGARNGGDAVQARIVQLLRAYGMDGAGETSLAAGSINLTA